MSGMHDALEALRAAVAGGGQGSDERIRRAAGAAIFADAQVVTTPGGGPVDHVIVTLVEPVPVGELEAAFGPARDLPRRPAPSAPRQVLFDATLPAEGSTGATVIAEVDDEGRTRRIVVRRDEL